MVAAQNLILPDKVKGRKGLHTGGAADVGAIYPPLGITISTLSALKLYDGIKCYRGTWEYDYDYDYDYIMAPQRGRPYGANLGSMGRNTGTWSIRSECLSNITSWSRRKGIENTTLPFIPE